MGSEGVGTLDWASELVITSGRSVGCVRTLVGVTRSEPITTELVLAAPSKILALVSTDSNPVGTADDSSNTKLEGVSVTGERVEMSVELKTSVWASPMEVIDGESVTSGLENTDSVDCIRTLVGVANSLPKGTALVLVSSRSIPELLVSGKLDTIVSEGSIWETALDNTSGAEASVGASVMICENVVCVSDVIDGSSSVVSARMLVGERSDAIVELSTTIELMVGTSWAVELVLISPRPVGGSGATVADVSRSEMVLDGRGRSLVTGKSSVTGPEFESVAEGIAWTLVTILEIKSDDPKVGDWTSKLGVMDGNSIVSSWAMDSGSTVKLPITADNTEELSWMVEPSPVELLPGPSGAVVTEGRVSMLVIYGRSVIGVNVEVAPTTASVLAMTEAESSDVITEMTPVGVGSRLIAELSATDGTTEEISWPMELVSR
jgi:hypothetical protein